MAGNNDLTLTVESSAGGVEPGDDVTGVVQGVELRTIETSDGDVNYVDVTIEEEESGITLVPSWPARITDSTGLGSVLQQMGVEIVQGKEVDLGDVFSPGTRVAFTVGKEDAPDDHDRDYFLRVDDTTLRPAGEDVDETHTQDDAGDEDDQLKAEVLEVVSDMEGEDKSQITKKLVNMSNEHFKVFKEMKGSAFTEDDGEIALA